MKDKVQEAIKAARQTYGPQNNYGRMRGLAVDICGEAYAVVADWAEASSGVYIYHTNNGWSNSRQQVANYQHDEWQALYTLVEECIRDMCEDEEERENCEIPGIDHAIEFDIEEDVNEDVE